MLPHLLAASALIVAILGARPPDYSEQGLCDLWAGARCHAASCLPDAKARCAADSSLCQGRTRSTVSTDRAEKIAACARAMLLAGCGAPSPAECDGVSAP